MDVLSLLKSRWRTLLALALASLVILSVFILDLCRSAGQKNDQSLTNKFLASILIFRLRLDSNFFTKFLQLQIFNFDLIHSHLQFNSYLQVVKSDEVSGSRLLSDHAVSKVFVSAAFRPCRV